jgi:AcrR family transcriptional regulator
MSISKEMLVEAAIRVILRYGVRRTTMHDIATEAGVSRQTLYAVFANKEAVLRGAVRLVADGALERIERGCAEATSLDTQLDIVFEELALAPFRLVHSAPEANDIVDGLTAACADEVREASARYRLAIERVLAPYMRRLEGGEVTPEALSDFVQSSLHAFKKLARDEPHLRELLATLKHLLLTRLRDQGVVVSHAASASSSRSIGR